MGRIKKIFALKNVGYVLFLIVFTIVALEVILHFYNPFASRLRGNKIVLPVNRVHHIENNDNPKLDRTILHSTNSLGFRGPDKPDDLEKYLSIVAVGGSTTECYYLSDDKTWTYILEQGLQADFNNVWLNNAGLDGHSTFGHQILLDDFLVRLKPKVILYFIGSNDEDREDLVDYDKSIIDSDLANLLKKSEIFNIYLNYRRAEAAKRLGVTHKYIDFKNVDTLSLSDEQFREFMSKHYELAARYRARLIKLVESTRAAGIEPVLLTQPTVVGEGIDPETGVDLEKIKLSNDLNGMFYWKRLELINQHTREVGAATNTLVIDLANKMPRNTIYYYDSIHFTNAGAAKIAELIASELGPHLRSKFPEYIKPGG